MQDTVVSTKYWHREADGRLQCDLCPRHCRLRDGQRGLCYVRQRLDDERRRFYAGLNERRLPSFSLMGGRDVEQGLLAGVSNTARGGTWAAGSTTINGSERPYIVRIVNGRWRRPSMPRVGPGALAAMGALAGAI